MGEMGPRGESGRGCGEGSRLGSRLGCVGCLDKAVRVSFGLGRPTCWEEGRREFWACDCLVLVLVVVV